MARILIPPFRVPLTDSNGYVSQIWYTFFSQFLQGLSDDTTGTAVDLTALTGRVTLAETDVDTLQAADLALQAADTALAAADTAFAAADRDLQLDETMRPDRGAEIDELRKRVAQLETELSLLTDPGSSLEALAKKLRDLETDIAMR